PILVNTKWMIYEDDGDQRTVTFQSDGTFKFYKIKSSYNVGVTYDDDEDTWTLEGNNLILSYTD
ncbi:MAG: hypothetical protein VX852_04185, partial [Candidatus Neomarinimicrobiota bacterium]|nr:hypothetical protein [Candidatus Neomarinimicrobiota bacterium]